MQTIVCFINNLLDNNTALQYNKKHKEMPATNKHLPRGFNPRRSPQSNTYNQIIGFIPKT